MINGLNIDRAIFHTFTNFFSRNNLKPLRTCASRTLRVKLLREGLECTCGYVVASLVCN